MSYIDARKRQRKLHFELGRWRGTVTFGRFRWGARRSPTWQLATPVGMVWALRKTHGQRLWDLRWKKEL